MLYYIIGTPTGTYVRMHIYLVLYIYVLENVTV